MDNMTAPTPNAPLKNRSGPDRLGRVIWFSRSERMAMTTPSAPTPNAPAGAVKCPDCGNALRHVAGEDWACSQCKDPQTQSGQRYWRVVMPAAPTGAEVGELTAEERSRVRNVFSLIVTMPPGREHTTVPCDDLRLVAKWAREQESALLAARRDADALTEWKQSILGLLQTFPEFQAAEWGGNKTGWGFVFEFIKWLNRDRLAARREVEAARDEAEARFAIYGRLLRGVQRTINGDDVRDHQLRAAIRALIGRMADEFAAVQPWDPNAPKIVQSAALAATPEEKR